MTLLEVTHLKKTYTGIFSTQAVQALKDINFSVEKAFRIIVFTEKNKKDLLDSYHCEPEKIVIQNLTPILPNIYEKHKDKDFLKIFNGLNLNSEFQWFFYPAQFWPHKNHKYLIDVMNYFAFLRLWCDPCSFPQIFFTKH